MLTTGGDGEMVVKVLVVREESTDVGEKERKHRGAFWNNSNDHI